MIQKGERVACGGSSGYDILCCCVSALRKIIFLSSNSVIKMVKQKAFVYLYYYCYLYLYFNFVGVWNIGNNGI